MTRTSARPRSADDSSRQRDARAARGKPKDGAASNDSSLDIRQVGTILAYPCDVDRRVARDGGLGRTGLRSRSFPREKRMSTSLNKRNKEKQRQERQRENRAAVENGVDPDIAGIVPGPQPIETDPV